MIPSRKFLFITERWLFFKIYTWFLTVIKSICIYRDIFDLVGQRLGINN